MPKRNRLDSITGLKVIATLLIFVWHTDYLKAPDLGARCVEVFFIASGLLMAWNHEGLYKGTIKECLSIFRQKVLKLYPIYIFGVLLVVLNMLVTQSAQGMSIKGLLPTAIAHLTMTQAWFRGIAFKFDGAAWYLSAILFCYAATPVLSFLVSADELATKKRKLAVLGLGCLAFALVIELGTIWYPEGFLVSAHSWPPVCLARYGIGYAVGCWLLLSDSRMVLGKKMGLAVVEIAVSVAVLLAVVLLDRKLLKVGFTLLFAVWIALLAIGAGPVSKLLSAKALCLPARWELEFYVLHQPVLWLSKALLGPVCTRKVYVLVALTVTVVLAVAFKGVQGRICRVMRTRSTGAPER